MSRPTRTGSLLSRDSGMGRLASRVAPVALLLAAVWIGPARAAAQTAASAPTSAPVLPADVDLSPEALQTQIGQVQAASDLPAEVKDKLLATYKQALDEVRLAEKWSTRSKELSVTGKQVAEVKAQGAALATMPAATAPAEANLDKLKQSLSAAKASLIDVDKTAQDLDTRIRSHATRRTELPKLISEARKQIDQLSEKLGQPPTGGSPPQVVKAEQVLARAHKKALEQEVASEEKELLQYEAVGELLTAQKDLLSAQRRRLEAHSKLLEEAVNKASREEAAKLEEKARQTARELADAHPIVRELAEGDLRLAERLNGPNGLLAQIRDISTQSQAAARRITEVRKDADVTRERVERAGVTQAIAALLLKKRNDLLAVQRSLRTQAPVGPRIAEAQVRKDELSDQRASLSHLDQSVRETLARVQTPLGPVERENLEWAVRKQLESRAKYLDELTSQYDAYFNLLVDLDTNQKQFKEVVDSFKDYLDERILWFRNAPPLGWGAWGDARDALWGLARPAPWREVGGFLLDDARETLFLPAVAALLLVCGLALRRRLRAAVRRWGEQAAKANCVSLAPTFRAIAVSLLLACLWPALIALPGWRLGVAANGDGAFASAVSAGLLSAAGLLLMLGVGRYACLPGGLGQMHFRWKPSSVKLLHGQLRWLDWCVVPLGGLVALLEAYSQDSWRDSLGRVAMMAALVLTAVFVQRVLRPQAGLWIRPPSSKTGKHGNRFRVLWYPLAVLAPLVLAALAAVGYSYTALRMTGRLLETIWLVLTLGWVHGLIVRWLFLARRKMAIRLSRQAAEARQSQAQAQAQAQASPARPRQADAPPPPLPATLKTPDPRLDVIAISDQTLQLLRLAVALAFLVSAWLIWYDVLPALRIFHRVPLWPGVTLADLGTAIFVLLITFAAIKNIPGLLGMVILPRLDLKDDVRFAITTLVRYVLMIVGFVVAFSMIGVDWSKVQWLVAAITVGLGFGLQEIFANFVSGLILLFERPIRVGDTVTMGQISGQVTRIQMRATTITDWDRKELVVPNKEFITGRFVNWTLSDRVLRVLIPVGIAYGSDPKLACGLLLKAAQDHPNVLKDPAPSALFMGFGESALNFELRAFVGDLSHGLLTRHELNVAIAEAFREAGIEIAYPQMDLHLRTMAPGPPFGGEGAGPGLSSGTTAPAGGAGRPGRPGETECQE